jgi:hypothetical protein
MKGIWGRTTRTTFPSIHFILVRITCTLNNRPCLAEWERLWQAAHCSRRHRKKENHLGFPNSLAILLRRKSIDHNSSRDTTSLNILNSQLVNWLFKALWNPLSIHSNALKTLVTLHFFSILISWLFPASFAALIDTFKDWRNRTFS